MNKLNDRFERHGYWEHIWFNNGLLCKGNYFNGQEIGYWEWYNSDGNLIEKKFVL